MSTHARSRGYLTFKLFPSNSTIAQDELKYINFEARVAFNHSLAYIDKFLFCGDKYGVIYEYQGLLYQLDLKQLNLTSELYLFEQILGSCFDTELTGPYQSHAAIKRSWLSMGYMQVSCDFLVNIYPISLQKH